MSCSKKAIAYAGPEGDCGEADARNSAGSAIRSCGSIAGNLDRPIVYDRGLRRFFAIDWRGKTVQSGPAVACGCRRLPLISAGLASSRDASTSVLKRPKPHYTYGMNPERVAGA